MGWIKSLLLALPAAYLLAIGFVVFTSGDDAVPPPTSFTTAPARLLVNLPNFGGKGKGAAAAEPAAANGIGDTSVLGSGSGPLNRPAPPPKPAAPLRSVTYFDGTVVKVHEYKDPFLTGKVEDDWWDSVKNGWETESLRTLKMLLTNKPGATYLDFGAWIGPTIVYAAQFAAKAYSMEPDARAYSNVYWNVKANPQLSSKVTVLPLCIAGEPGELVMRGSPGNSMSSVASNLSAPLKPGEVEWHVECTTLETFCTREGIDPRTLVMKVDTEGAEKNILVKQKAFFLKYKPPMLLSMHSFAYEDAPAHELADMVEIFNSYKSWIFSNGEIVDRNAFHVISWCRFCALILSDDDIKPSDFKAPA